ncbi:MAG TPA: outer membrane beta-barrel protein [Tepidisphaeraceae bacterium]|jgi:hypothetical protein|nr:outer membrane beta-barrel protein [Tepidisphaeraceae bacterium]
MLRMNSLAVVAGILVLGHGVVRADDRAAPPRDYAVARPTLLATAPPPHRRPLMNLLEQAGVAKPLDDAGINIYGHVEGGWTYNFDDPDDDLNPFRIFDFEHNEPILDQFDFTVERLVDYRKNKFDVGFRAEIMYGADAGIIHSNGLFDWYDGIRKPENQWDLTQAYVDVVVPVGTGLRLRMGKFVNFVGYETINPTTGGIVDFYSRSLIFFNYPFTHTGIIGTYDITRDVTLTLGVTRGDNQSTEDNNDAVSFLGSINWVINDQWALYFSNSTGPERTDNNSDYRATFDATLYFTPNKEFTAAGNIYYVFEEGGAAGGDDAQLVAFALLGAYQINEMLTVKGRVEWMHDDDNYRLGPVEDIYEATVGLTIKPFPNDQWGSNVKIRPEVRWDHSPDNAFHGDDDQFTFGVDVVVTY